MLTQAELDSFGVDLNFEVGSLAEQDALPTVRKHVPIYTADIETDPFQAGRYPKPFACDFYDGSTHSTFWGIDCIERMCSYIETKPTGIIYLHNGGRFDIYYLIKMVRGYPALIINGRIVRTFCKSNSPSHPHEVRDSYAIMPFALARYKKDSIDYTCMEVETREENRAEIIKYMQADTTYLHELCIGFLDLFGNKLTVGSAAMRELMKHHQFESLSNKCDGEIRSEFYYGGRVQYFQRGILPGPWTVFDVNSMYPYVMKAYEHPTSMPSSDSTKIRKSTCFVKVRGKNYGAFPTRSKKGLRFDIEDGVFSVTIHEFNTALEYDLFKPDKIIRCVNFGCRSNFASFVDYVVGNKIAAEEIGDMRGRLFWKFISTSAYGKFAQNYDKYMEYCITEGDTNLTTQGWKPYETDDITKDRSYIIWKKKPELTNDRSARNYNVATGASITGASRAVLMESIAKATEPIYCDTDSIICRSLEGVSMDSKKLGGWKQEAIADTACIGGKKLYALFDKEGVCVKQANKGVNLTPEQIREVCEGKVITSERIAPSFHLDGSYNFITRKVRMT